jgi:excisionase family DNA binding protein
MKKQPQEDAVATQPPVTRSQEPTPAPPPESPSESDLVEPLLDAKEAAEILKVSPRLVQQWVKNGDLVAIHLGKLVRITRADLRRFILSRRSPPRPNDVDPSGTQYL